MTRNPQPAIPSLFADAYRAVAAGLGHGLSYGEGFEDAMRLALGEAAAASLIARVSAELGYASTPEEAENAADGAPLARPWPSATVHAGRTLRRWRQTMSESSESPEPILTCRCGIKFRFRFHARTGKRAPITLAEHPAGNVALVGDLEYRLIGKRESYDGPRYLNHFTDCPESASFARTRGSH